MALTAALRELYNWGCNPMLDRLGVRSNHPVLAVVLGIAGTLQVGCTSCLSAPRPTPTQRLEEALRQDALRKAERPASPTPPPVAPPACPTFGSYGAPTAPPEGHRVILSWNASTPADSKHAAAAGYCIYRGVKQKDPSPVLLNKTPFPGTSCVDDLVVNDQKYYYVVRAISAQGITSIVSNEASAKIPKRSNPPASRALAPLCRVPAGLK
jgi:hypothetical protein